MHFTTASAATTLAAVLATYSTTTLAHVILETPRPFKWANDGHFNPLEPDGSDFPCKKYPGQTLEVDGERTVMAKGANQTLSFQGLAVHGGGSCQLSLTRDLQPTPESEWMVIHSIEGGCPARNQAGNLLAENDETYSFVIPEGIDDGEYTFSWTWSNRISGSAEFYQNCAPITVVGSGSGNAKRRTLKKERAATAATTFPELFLANLGALTGDCTTNEAVTQQLAIAYPNPGNSVERPEGDASLFQQPCDGNPRAGPGGGSDGGTPPSSGGQPSHVSSSAATATATATATSGPPEPVSTTTVTTEPAPTTEIKTTSTFVTSIATTSPSAEPSTDDNAQPTQTTSSIPPDPTGGVCTEGYLTCMDDGLGFKTCTGGILRPDNEAILVPPGYKCTPGSGLGLDLHPI